MLFVLMKKGVAVIRLHLYDVIHLAKKNVKKMLKMERNSTNSVAKNEISAIIDIERMSIKVYLYRHVWLFFVYK